MLYDFLEGLATESISILYTYTGIAFVIFTFFAIESGSNLRQFVYRCFFNFCLEEIPDFRLKVDLLEDSSSLGFASTFSGASEIVMY